jgi:hypothetical protein
MPQSTAPLDLKRSFRMCLDKGVAFPDDLILRNFACRHVVGSDLRPSAASTHPERIEAPNDTEELLVSAVMGFLGT